MTNVFDLIADFYEQDEEWNVYLHRSCVEDFIRLKSMQGAAKQELIKYWDYLTVLCIYLGNAEILPGDMDREDFVDCVGWCCRNVADFPATPANIDAFLRTMEEFFAFMRKKKVISGDKAPAEARAKLLQEGRVQMLDSTGHFYPEYARFNAYATADLPAKVFLNIGERIEDVVNAVQSYYSAKKFRRDIERASFLYSGVMINDVSCTDPGSEEYAHCFWDYFLFDYHMLADDKTPLQHFYDDALGGGLRTGNLSRDVLQELLQTELVLFTIEDGLPDGSYVCRNFLTGEQYLLMLPVDGEVEVEGFVFLGHLFYNQSMLMNYIRGVRIPTSACRRFLREMTKFRDWFGLRLGREVTWQDFIRRNPIFLRHMVVLYSTYIRLEGFEGYAEAAEQYASYVPRPVRQDQVSLLIRQMLESYVFSAYDIFLAQTMWSDFLQASGKDPELIRAPEIWAAGVISEFIKLNRVYNYKIDQISTMCYHVPPSVIRRTGSAVREALQLQRPDPRYVNEEGMLLMLLS